MVFAVPTDPGNRSLPRPCRRCTASIRARENMLRTMSPARPNGSQAWSIQACTTGSFGAASGETKQGRTAFTRRSAGLRGGQERNEVRSRSTGCPRGRRIRRSAGTGVTTSPRGGSVRSRRPCPLPRSPASRRSRTNRGRAGRRGKTAPERAGRDRTRGDCTGAGSSAMTTSSVRGARMPSGAPGRIARSRRRMDAVPSAYGAIPFTAPGPPPRPAE